VAADAPGDERLDDRVAREHFPLRVVDLEIRHQAETTLPLVPDESMTQRLIVKDSPGRGRGVFALRDFEEGALIESAPVIVLPVEDRDLLRLTTLARYQFNWRVKGATAIPLGYGMIHNHSPEPNARWENDADEDLMHFIAVRAISRGEEITTNYGRGLYRKGSVDPPPWWWLALKNFRPKPKRPVVMLGAGAAILGVAWHQRRRLRRSSAGDE
jgi:hypothetical protein